MSKEVPHRYPAWNGEALTFEEISGELGDYIAHLLLQTTPHEYVSDCKQEALLKLWLELQHDGEWIKKRGFTNKGGLARRLAYDGRQQHGAWGPVQRLYEQRVVNEATLNDWMTDEIDEDDAYLTVGDHPYASNRDFWRDLSELEPRNLDVILYADGCNPDWRNLADMRLDLVAAIDHVFENIKKDKHERTGWALMNLVYGITVEQAAYMAGITRPAMNAHIIRCRKLMREKLIPYQTTNLGGNSSDVGTLMQAVHCDDQQATPPEMKSPATLEGKRSPLTIPQLNVWLKLLTQLVQMTQESDTNPSRASKHTEDGEYSSSRLLTLGVVSVILKLAKARSKHSRRESPEAALSTIAKQVPLGRRGSSSIQILMDGVLLTYPL